MSFVYDIIRYVLKEIKNKLLAFLMSNLCKIPKSFEVEDRLCNNFEPQTFVFYEKLCFQKFIHLKII